MKTECGIIQDLLPLYVDGVCSPESQVAVAQHLQECDACRERHRRMTAALPEQAEPEELEKGRTLRRGLKKVRRRWILSLVAALLAVPLLLMSVAQVTGDGICFTNLGQIARSYQFLSCLKKGDYEKAFDMLDMEGKWKDLTDYDSFMDGSIRAESYQPIVIDGKTWMFLPDALTAYFDEVPDALDGEAALDFWENVHQRTQSNYATYLVPAEAYDALKARGRWSDETWDGVDVQEPLYVEDHDGNGYRVGTYYTSSDEEQLDLYQCCYDVPCVPETLWQTMEEAQKQYKLSFEQRAAQYLSMGYAQWLEKSREQFVTGMRQWEAEYGRITRIRFHAAYNTGLGSKMSRIFSGEWQLEFDLWFTASESGGEGITLWIHDGKVTSIGGYCRSLDDSNVVSSFLEALARLDCYLIPDGEQG